MRTVSRIKRRPPRSMIAGGRITQRQTPRVVRNIISQPMRGVAGLSTISKQQQASITQRTGKPVTVTFASGQKRTMKLSIAAIKSYQKQGLRVSPVQQTFGRFNPMQSLVDAGTGVSNWFKGTPSAFAEPAIPRIQEQTPPWTENPPKQLHVAAKVKVKPNTRTNSNFGGLGANPWNPVQGISGLFNMNQQEQPESQYLPQQQNTQSTGYPTYTAFAQGQYQEDAFAETPRGFQTSMLGDSSFDAGSTIKNLASNQYVIIGGLALGALVVLKIIMGGSPKVVYGR